MGKLMDRWEKEKKDKSSKHYHDQWRHFSQFVKNLSRLMTEKMEEPILYV